MTTEHSDDVAGRALINFATFACTKISKGQLPMSAGV